MTPVAATTSRTRLLPLSATKMLPAASTNTPRFFHCTSGQTAPGINGAATFSSFSNLSTDNTDRITFFSVLSTGTDAIYQQTAANSPQLVAQNTQAAPSPAGGSLGLLPSPAVRALNNGSTFFPANVQGGTANFGEFLGSPGSLTLLMSTADTLPAGARVRLSNPMYSSANVLAFSANLTGGQSALFEEAISTGVTTRLVGEGDLIPGTGGSSVIESPGPSSRYYLNDNGQVAFFALLSAGQAVLVAQPTGGVSVVAATGQTAPVTGNPTFTSFVFSSNTTSVSPINDSGQVAFSGTLSSGVSGIFLGSANGGLSQVAITGQTVPEGGATFTSFSACNQCLVALNNSGQVVFGALKSNGQGIYGWTQGALAKVVASTDTLSGIRSLSTFDPVSGFNTGGQVAFEPIFNGGVLVGTATGGTPTELALDGNAAPGTGGGTLFTGTILYAFGNTTFVATTTNASTDDCGDVVFRASVTGGTANSGYFGVVNSNCGGSVGPLQALALQGQSVPGAGTLGAIFDSTSTDSLFSLNEGNPGVLAFTNSFTNGSVHL
jgi:hypothetical protein